MISNSLGAMPRGVYDAMKGYADTWAARGVRAWEERWWMLGAQVGDELGALINAPKGTVSTHQNVTTCQAVLASCLDFSGKRNKVVYSDMNFPSVMYFWEAQRPLGARVHMVKTDGISVATEQFLDAIDVQTVIVLISRAVPQRLHQRRRRHREPTRSALRHARTRFIPPAPCRSTCRNLIPTLPAVAF
jgi:kynureninase